MSFVFYDTETTGLSTRFDQILHFAAIRTDNELNEVDRYEVRSRLRSHVFPHPEALCINSLGIGQLCDPSLPSHYEMACSMRAKLLAWSPSIFAGYNSIRFDEELMRQTFFETLHPPYLTSLHGNGRADVLGLALAAAEAGPANFVVPRTATGRPSFKLIDIARANGISHSRTHHAMSDAQATLDLCRTLRHLAPAAWQSFVRFSNKAAVADFVAGEDAFLLTEFFGGEAYSSPVVLVGPETSTPTGRWCLVINAATRDLISLDDATLALVLRARPSPMRRIRTNSAPFLTPLYDIDEEVVDLGIEEIEALAKEIRSDNALCMRLINVMESGNKPWPTSIHVEERIYEGFPSNSDSGLMEQFHQSNWGARPRLLERIQDDRIRTLGLRLIHSEAPSALIPSQQQRVADDLHSRGQCAEGPLTRGRAAELVRDMKVRASLEEQLLLDEYLAYLA